ncbi:hypothetical protein [Mucilaginibacter sp.]|uniref:hypothetical protein n=1 Tax=Mucilaginibacter sp. TaxID=1882438 RepID=UPI00263A329E|nr:hypothetical protein [Mucilaginibacter sp.]MDB4923409.1 hypothetical protein [Mucilaginibacter sp.]
MVFANEKRSAAMLYNQLAILCLLPVFLQSCGSNKKIYKSNCDVNITFKKVGFTQLIDSIKNYDQQYVEVSGTYREAKEQSALYNDSLFVDHSKKHALWVNFSQDCPLYLKGTRTGLFEASDGEFTPMNNKKIIIRGRVDLHNTGHLGLYKGAIDRVSSVEL